MCSPKQPSRQHGGFPKRLFVMLSRFDTVHSMIAMSCAALAICGMSFQSCLGAGAMIGIYNNNLNTNIPFLLLGLGIDDAFVLTSEFRRAKQCGWSTILRRGRVAGEGGEQRAHPFCLGLPRFGARLAAASCLGSARGRGAEP